jgi:diguanylate cyclase
VAIDNEISALQKNIKRLQLQQDVDQSDLDALTRVTVRLCLASKDLDRELDTSLAPFQELLKNNVKGVLQTNSGAAEKALMNYFQRRDQAVEKNLMALRAMLTGLRERADSPTLKIELDILLRTLAERVDNYGDYPQLLSSTASMLSAVLAQAMPDIAGQEAAGAASSSEDVAAVEDDAAEQLSLLGHHVSAILLELLGQLSIPQHERAAARKLIKQLEQGFDWQQLPVVIDAIATLVLNCLVVRQEDFENYLTSLNLQVVDIHGFLIESRDHQHAHRESSQTLDLVVRNDLSQVERSLSQAGSLDQLKSSVRLQLAGIVKAMDNYRSEQEDREQQVGTRLEQLQQKLEAMEEQSLRMQAHLEEQRMRSISDPLTTLPNRAAYNDRVEQEFAHQRRYQHPLTMVVCDIDHFKRINDSYGHLAGDKVLRLVANLISDWLRDTDFVARYGGEEFVVLMPETAVEKAKMAIEQVRKAVAQSPFNFEGQPVQITLSFGLTRVMEGDASPDVAFQRADDALYQAKQQGRNCSVIG